MLSAKFIQLKVPGVNKLLPKYVGPCAVARRLSDVRYQLDLPPCMQCHNVFHLSLLKPYREDGRVQPPPLPFEFVEDEGLWYELDGILQHRVVNRGSTSVLQYLCSFKGYDASHNQWCDACGVTALAKDEYHHATGTSPPVFSAPSSGRKRSQLSALPAAVAVLSAVPSVLPRSSFADGS